VDEPPQIGFGGGPATPKKPKNKKEKLLTAKVPLSILGLPFQSRIVAGESKELTLNLGTFFKSSPSLKIAYCPNDTWNPFSLVVKTGTGPWLTHLELHADERQVQSDWLRKP
jgi:hypothetical protein